MDTLAAAVILAAEAGGAGDLAGIIQLVSAGGALSLAMVGLWMFITGKIVSGVAHDRELQSQAEAQGRELAARDVQIVRLQQVVDRAETTIAQVIPLLADAQQRERDHLRNGGAT